MPAPKRSRKWVVIGLFVAGMLAGGAVAAWVERTPLLAWYYVRNLAAATEQDRAAWADRVAGLGEGAEPAVFACLDRPDDLVCRNAGAVLDVWVSRLSADGAGAAALADRMAAGWTTCSPAGRRTVLTAAAGWFRPGGPAPADGLLAACSRLVAQAADVPETEAHVAALDLCSLALERVEDAKAMLTAGRALVKKSLSDDSATTRLRAVQVSLHFGADLLEEDAGLLKDAEPRVRLAALLAVGPADEKVVSAKCLLPVLHDADPEVRKACEEVLRKDRRLSPLCLKIGWHLYHPDAAERVNVLDYLQRGPDVEPGAWLRELSHDDSPAVRLAAVRAMSQLDGVDLSDRLEQMADNDPSPTVCQMARLYEKWAKSGAHDADR